MNLRARSIVIVAAIAIVACSRESSPIRRSDEKPKPRACELPADGIAPASLVLNAPCDAKLPKGLRVRAGSRLEIGPGVRLAFAAGTSLTIEPGGSIAAKGTVDAPIVLTSAAEKPAAGDWIGVRFAEPVKVPAPDPADAKREAMLRELEALAGAGSFAELGVPREVAHRRPFTPWSLPSPPPKSPAPSASGSAVAAASDRALASALVHVVIEDAGGRPSEGVSGAIVVERAAPGLVLTDVSVRSSAHMALFVAQTVDPSTIEAARALHLASREGVAARVPAELLGRLGDSTFDGLVETHGRVTTSATWPASATEIWVTADLIVDGPTAPTLTFAPSTKIRFSPSSGLFVATGPTRKGSIVASKVSFAASRTPGRAGDWRGITLDGLATGTRIVDSTIEHAGDGAIQLPKDERGVEIHDDTFVSLAGFAIESWTDCAPFRLKSRAIVAPAGKECTFHAPPKAIDLGDDDFDLHGLRGVGADGDVGELGVVGGSGSARVGGIATIGGGTRARGAEGAIGAPMGAGSAATGAGGATGILGSLPSKAPAPSSSK